ncbi:MAG: lipoate--protein ligase family protein [Clostridia bacterium]|nr:lipoate--protein ligase family protein [Clostridia bacterium]
MFKFISHDIHNAYFNLASEEYLLKIKGGYYFYLWVNEPAVIVGINQNTLAEVNLQYVDKNDIKVVRRLTGGGAVYHDLENICYTVIAPYNQNEDNYKKFTAPVIEYLNSLGVKAEFSGRNDITVDGKKISGNAQTIVGDKIMHHGTLLFKTNMEVLEGALKPNKLKVESKYLYRNILKF